ncbi:MAG: hypothetical protein ACE5H3_10980 [Planctomycetota bacterium]
MIRTLFATTLGLLAFPLGGLKTAQDKPLVLQEDLSWNNWTAWKHFLVPSSADRIFEKIPWIPSFGAGILQAQKQGMPLLLWVMNGHPLGCT